MNEMHDETTAAALLDAGAVLPPGSTAREDADTLTVRTYTHPALGDRPVVRLVPGTLGEAEDLALEFLGLAREPETPEVGQVRRETLGFPAWALVHDPANGHHALALVKDVERLARQAKSRPGTAREGFEALGTRLGRAVPHFLPTFYEQAARVFLQHENTTYAAAFFGKAREAERVHALTVDEERQRAVFLEFAFAGALTVKALKEHVKDLARRLDPAEAWAQFRQLTVERCAAGMPPYASLPQDARGLIKAAGLDRVTEECALVADLIASPAAVRAPASFWTAYRVTLPVLAEREPAVRARLLEIMPAGLGGKVEDDEFWLTLLAECGADRLLTGEDDAGGVDSAEWLGRWAGHRKHGGSVSDRSPATLALVARMAPRLRDRGRPVDIFSGRWHAGAELDLLDLCAAEGIPLAVPGEDEGVHLALDRWLRDDRPGRRDLTATAADPRLRRLLYDGVGALVDHRSANSVAQPLADHPVLGDVLRAWLDDTAGELVRAAGLPAARAALARLHPFRPVAARVNPEAVARIAGYAVAPLLGRTLRAGILDELGWPALEEAVALLGTETRADRDDTLTVHDAWPALILARRHKAVVAGPDGILLEHDLRLPVELDRWNRPQFRFSDGELLVMWRHDRQQYGYWSARPSEVFTLGGENLPHWYGDADIPSIPLAGGGRATGGRALHAGDTVVPPRRRVLGDGTTLWRQGRQGRQQVWLEYDPATGTHGRASLPAFLRSGIREGAALEQDACEVLPFQPGLQDSPFGTDGTVLGRWVRVEGEGAERRTTVGTPDGRSATLPSRHGRSAGAPLGALRLPGGAEPVAVQAHRQIVLFAADDTSAAGELGRVTVNDRGGEFAAGTRFVPSAAFWHALRPRDEEGSRLLRALTDEQVAEVLRAGAEALAERRERLAAAGESVAERQAVPGADVFVRDAVVRLLAGISDEQLLTGVATLVHGALKVADSTAAFAAPPKEARPVDRRRVDGMFADLSPEHGDDRTLREATAGLAHQHGWWHGGKGWTALRQIRSVNHVLSGRPADGKPLPERIRRAPLEGGWRSEEFTIPGLGLVWPPVLSVLRPLAYRAASPTLSEAHREALALLFEALAEGPLAVHDGTLREVVLTEAYDRQERVGQVLRQGERTVVILGCERVDTARDRASWLAADHDPTGAFGAVAHFTLTRETRFASDFPAQSLAAVSRLVRDKGAATWLPEAPQALAAATDGALGPVQAALLLAGLPENASGEVLALIGLKPGQRDLGNGLLASLGTDRAALVGALLPQDPADLWTSGPDMAAAGRLWRERRGGQVRLPEEVAAGLDLSRVPTATAEEMLNPARTPWLTRTTVQRLDGDGNLVAEDPKAMPGGSGLTHCAAALTSLAYGLPYGHPLRARLPEGLAALRRRVADPGLLLDLDISQAEQGGTTCVALRKAHGLPASGGAGADGLTRVGEALVLRPWYADEEAVLVRPAGLTGPDDAVFGLVEGLVGGWSGAGMRSLRAILGDDLARAVAAGSGPDGATGYAQDPAVSVPALVAEVAGAHGLSEDAAALYLQLLALPDPTDRNCVRWTGWKPARMKKARAELAATDLVVEAKRPRAGRTLFLPCGWLDRRSPALPMEIWKESLYPVTSYARAVPLVPVPELFARAWERVRAGDAPAYEELTTRATRKGRRR